MLILKIFTLQLGFLKYLIYLWIMKRKTLKDKGIIDDFSNSPSYSQIDSDNIHLISDWFLDELISKGHKPVIYIPSVMGEYTVFFNTVQEKEAAAREFMPEGWWYTKYELPSLIEWYKKEFNDEFPHYYKINYKNK